MNANQEVDEVLARQASQWVTVLRRKATPSELTAFAEWLRTSPRHVRDFLMMTALERELKHVDPEHRFGLHEWDESDSNVIELSAPRGPRQQRTRIWPWSVAAVLVISLMAVALLKTVRNPLTAWHEYATAVGEQRSFELEDGSVIQLNTHSRLKARLTAATRELDLVAGEALFKVRSDPRRPFLVHSGDVVIRALGTEFNVYRHEQGTTVSVIEGAVQVAAARLGAGEEAQVNDGQVQKRRQPDLARVVAWRQRRLIFDRDSLGDMVTEFNRYNKTQQLRVAGADIAARHYTGAFDADDPDSLAAVLASEPDLEVQRNGSEIIIRHRVAATY